ncbi:immunoglobulin lambda-1 light chain-like [Lacerta agilis]|uniref:immunoglobulin lambda-1 light chain-like n=1 Tax=Lacerta agilis TaxID=80427 RepID=UPI001419CB57|nr:immunoglobulin lambda-1 light chain-like [Lacerta agilis]
MECGTFSQFSLTQPPSMSASLGETTSISCRRSGGNIGTYNVAWYEQKPGGAPKLLIYWFGARSSGTPERFSGSVNKPSNTATLTISKLQPEDEADYYCLSYDGNYKYAWRCSPWGSSTDFSIMAWGLLRFTILVSIIGPSVQQLQTLKDTESVAPGGTVTMFCRFDSGNIGDGNYPLWAQKKPGSKPRTLIYTTSTRPSDVPARFSGSRSGNMMSLTITGALLEDEASYYCAVWTGSQRHSASFRWGSETKTSSPLLSLYIKRR